MTKKLVSLLICCVLALECMSLAGCEVQYEPIRESVEKHGVIETDSKSTFEKSVLDKNNYEVTDGEIADYLNYNFQDRSMYIAGLKIFEEFGTSNEGSVSISIDENALTFNITKATGTITGAVDGPEVYFTIDLAAKKITDKRFEPAPNYGELGKQEFIEHSKEIIQLTDERMLEIGEYFEGLIMKLETN